MVEANTPAEPIDPPGRRFDLIDFVIVLAAVAVAFSILWDMPDLYQGVLMSVASIGDWSADTFFRNWLRLSQGFAAFLAFPLCVASATIVALNLRYPHPPIEQLARQPGFMACATVVPIMALVILVTVKFFTLSLLAHPGMSGLIQQLSIQSFMMIPVPAASAVVASWLTLKLNRRWSPQQHWIDRAGRLVGWAWLIAAIL